MNRKQKKYLIIGLLIILLITTVIFLSLKNKESKLKREREEILSMLEDDSYYIRKGDFNNEHLVFLHIKNKDGELSGSLTTMRMKEDIYFYKVDEEERSLQPNFDSDKFDIPELTKYFDNPELIITATSITVESSDGIEIFDKSTKEEVERAKFLVSEKVKNLNNDLKREDQEKTKKAEVFKQKEEKIKKIFDEITDKISFLDSKLENLKELKVSVDRNISRYFERENSKERIEIQCEEEYHLYCNLVDLKEYHFEGLNELDIEGKALLAKAEEGENLVVDLIKGLAENYFEPEIHIGEDFFKDEKETLRVLLEEVSKLMKDINKEIESFKESISK